jgi:membrane protein
MAGILLGCKRKMNPGRPRSISRNGRIHGRFTPERTILEETPKGSRAQIRKGRASKVKIRIQIPRKSHVATVSDSDTSVETAVAGSQPVVEAGVIDATDKPAAAPEAATPVTESKWYRLRQDGTAIVTYLLDSEVHTFAFSVAANAILSFIPFIVLLYTIALSVFHSDAMADAVSQMVFYFFPSNQDFIIKNLMIQAPRHGIQVFSLIMILISCTGIFLPLEVALNQAWGVTKSRNYLMNQLVAFGLAILMVLLGLGSVLLSAGQRQALAFLFFHHTDNFIYNGISYLWLALCTGVACILFFFSIYWLLPNCKVPVKPVLRASIVVGLIWLFSKYVFVAILPHLDLKALYGPFYVSVGLLFWAYFSGLILFAGAQYSVARWNGKAK